ncbi:MAG TPA: hypothetical protein VGG64_29480 [Pirellulales bacterium]
MVRSLLWFLTLFAALTAAVWQFGGSAPRPEMTGYAWRRTVSGWEHVPQWNSPGPSEEPILHPLLVTSLLLAASLLALSAAPLVPSFQRRQQADEGWPARGHAGARS